MWIIFNNANVYFRHISHEWRPHIWVLRRSLRMGNRFARACISLRLTKPANTKLETHTRRVEISTIMAVEHKWSHTYLDAIIVEFCTQLRLRWRILVWLLRAPRRPDYAGGFSTLDGTTWAERKRRKKGGKNKRSRGETYQSYMYPSDVSSLWGSRRTFKYRCHGRNGTLQTECLIANYVSKSRRRRYTGIVKRSVGFLGSFLGDIFPRFLCAFSKRIVSATSSPWYE